VKPGRHEPDRVADPDRRAVREEVVDVGELPLEGLLLCRRQTHVDDFGCGARARGYREHNDRGDECRLRLQASHPRLLSSFAGLSRSSRLVVVTRSRAAISSGQPLKRLRWLRT
jgi:hypothetical protein